jgi:ankyrin repeat protein
VAKTVAEEIDASPDLTGAHARMNLSDRKTIAAVALLSIAVLWGIHYRFVTRLTRVTPLMMAARSGDASWVEKELRAGGDPNRVWNEGGFRVHGTGRRGVTALLFAVERAGPGTYSHAATVSALLASGANPCVTDNTNSSPLLIAVRQRDVDTVRVLWERAGSGCFAAQSSQAMLAGYQELAYGPNDPENWRLVEYLIDHVAGPGEADHPGALVASAQPEARDALERLIARGVKGDGESLMFASSYGKADLIPWLVEHGADVNAPIRGLSTDQDGPPLVRAAANPDLEGLRALIDAGADVNAADSAGRTALSNLVCETGCASRPNPICEKQLQAIRLLQERGARRAGTSRIGQDLDRCLMNRRADRYGPDLEALLGAPRATHAKSPSP